MSFSCNRRSKLLSSSIWIFCPSWFTGKCPPLQDEPYSSWTVPLHNVLNLQFISFYSLSFNFPLSVPLLAPSNTLPYFLITTKMFNCAYLYQIVILPATFHVPQFTEWQSTLCATVSTLCATLSHSLVIYYQVSPLSLSARSVSQMDSSNSPLLDAVFRLFHLLDAPQIPEWNAYSSPKLSPPMASLTVFFYFSLYFSGVCFSLCPLFSPSILNAESQVSIVFFFSLKIQDFLLIHLFNIQGPICQWPWRSTTDSDCVRGNFEPPVLWRLAWVNKSLSWWQPSHVLSNHIGAFVIFSLLWDKLYAKVIFQMWGSKKISIHLL